jgi:hypothetical protein
MHERSHQFYRRLEAQNALKGFDFGPCHTVLQDELNYIDRSDTIPMDELSNVLKRNTNIKIEIHKMLDFYEYLACGIMQGIYDPEVVKVGCSSSMKKAARAFEEYIKDRQARFNPRAWRNLQALTKQWQEEETRPETRDTPA